jgi:hypothetical protein
MLLRMRPGPRSLTLAALACALVHGASVHAETPAIAAKPFVPMVASKAVMAAWRKQLCALPELACAANPASLTLYHAAGDSPSIAWGILETVDASADDGNEARPAPAAPVLVKLRVPSTGGWALERKWDFAAYKHSDSSLASDTPVPTFVYPALYPVGPGTWAVAVVAGAAQMFSGGGAGYHSADFVVLGEGDPAVAAYSNVPFSCSKDLRGCFTEEDYRRSPNCSDLYEAFLTIAFRPSKSRERYVWTLTWHERHQAPGVPKSKTEVTETPADLPIDKVDTSHVTSSFSFCGGGIGSDPDEAPASAP